MLSAIFERPHTLARLRAGPAGPHLDDFTSWLQAAGFRDDPIRMHVRGAARFAEWAAGARFPIPAEIHDALARFEQRVATLGPGDRSAGGRRALVAGRLLAQRLVERGLTAGACPAGDAGKHELIVEFRQWMRRHRGVTESTLDVYAYLLAEFLEVVGDDPEAFRAESLRAWVLDRATRHGRSRAKTVVAATRMLLRFLISEGRCPVELADAIPTLAEWKLSSLPRYLRAEDVDRVVAACDPSTPVGARDRAIILLLARLGLRAGDVTTLALEDIDWREASVLVAGKSRRQCRLPLPQEVGDAVLHYLESGRPRTAVCDTVFTTTRAPIGPVSRQAVSSLVRRAIGRAGIDAPARGAHVLRHSAATAMLGQGMSLHDIGAVLRHSSVNTTGLYAKVDTDLLAQVVVPWPEPSGC